MQTATELLCRLLALSRDGCSRHADRILDSLSEALMHKISVLPSPAANSMYIRMCICMCLSYSPNKGGTTEGGFLLAFYRSTFVDQDFLSPPTCLDLPRLA